MIGLRDAQKIGGVLALAWSDGREDFLDLGMLRAACPCAACAGEATPFDRKPAPRAPGGSAELAGWSFVGGYGLQLRWGDGHSTGIYTFDYLRRLGSVQQA